MNNLLHLKGTIQQKSNTSRPGAPNIPRDAKVSIKHLIKLLDDLEQLSNYWEKNEYINGALISVYYTDVVAKSRRIQGFFKGKLKTNDSIVGARFTTIAPKKHIITHFVEMGTLSSTIDNLKYTIEEAERLFRDEIKHSDIENINSKNILYENKNIAKTNFVRLVVDAYYVEEFSVYQENENLLYESLITIFDTKQDTKRLLRKIGINVLPHRIFDDNTIFLLPEQFRLLQEKAPYLISMAVTDISEIDNNDFNYEKNEDGIMSISSPNNEPIIGVIDTMFDENVYFSEWVDFINMIPEEIQLTSQDYEHGTAVSSIIVDGPNSNPILDDRCGKFRVKHFGVAPSSKFSSFTILKTIQEVVASNPQIKVWNLSLGSAKEINSNFISPEAAMLDKIQYENDVIFVIAGTNKNPMDKGKMSIGSPADSINSLVVNSVKQNKEPATYTRDGLVLSFYNKPDVSYYGGDTDRTTRVCTPNGEAFVKGTSFAAPWIARKLAYMIEVLGLSREEAKALIIDSSTRWDEGNKVSTLKGYGVVPIKIDDVVHSKDDEIQFIISGISEKYDTYTYNIPVPVENEKHPFLAKATLCYFPHSSRNQGVDYTSTELDLKFGRLDSKFKLKPIDNNVQDEEGSYVYEENARKLYRKWDNVKHISELFKVKTRPRKAYDSQLWGLSIKTKERLEIKYGDGLKFSVIVTLKEINGKNRIEDFIQLCQLRGWLVNQIDVENRIDIYEKAEEEIEFD